MKAGLFACNGAGTTSDLQLAFDFELSNPIPLAFEDIEVIVALLSTSPDATSGPEEKLTAAAASQSAARGNQLSALQSQVRAESGKTLTPDQAQFLIRFAQSLM